MGINFGRSKSSQQATSQQQAFVDPAQTAFLRNLRTQATQLQGQQQGQIGSLFGLAGGLQGQGQNFLSNLAQTQQQLGQAPQGLGQQLGNVPGAQGIRGGQAISQLTGGIGGGISALQGIAGGQGQSQASQALAQQAFGQSPVLGQQIGQLGEDINRQFQRQVGGAGGITAGAIGAGQGGLGGRAQVATGLASEAALNAFSRGATDLRGQDIGRQLGAAQALGGLESQGIQQQLQAGQALGQFGLGGLGALGQQQQIQQGGQQLGLAGQQIQLGQQGLGFQQQQLQQQGLLGAGQLGLGGLGALQGQFNLGFSPFQSQFQPLQNLAGIIGAPTVLNQGFSQSTGGASGFNFGAALFGGGGGGQ